jgi:voltage-gated potassium channel
MLANRDPKFAALGRRWVDSSNIPLAVLGLVYLATYAIQVIYRTNEILVSQLEIVSIVIWFIFAVDVVLRLAFASSFINFIKSNWLEIFALTLPFLRVLRVFRAVIALRGIKGFFQNRVNATGAYILMLVPLTWFTGAIAVLDAEAANSNALITNLREALWWSLSTITTVGYGDRYPTTLEGELVAGVLMITGIALFSAGAGMFASWILAGKKDTGSKS